MDGYLDKKAMHGFVKHSGFMNCSMESAVDDGRFWAVQTKGEALIITAKMMEGVQLLNLFGLWIKTRDVEQCDMCNGYSFSCAGTDDGPSDGDGGYIAMVWFCHDCVRKSNSPHLIRRLVK